MPKVKQNSVLKINRWLKEINDQYLNFDGQSVYCSVCSDKEVTCDRKSQLTQHLNTARHKNSARSIENVVNESDSDSDNQNDNLNASSSKKSNEFFFDMCQAMIAVRMSWRCLDNDVWRNFLAKYTHRSIPHESTIRKNYLDKCYTSTLNTIRSEIGDNYIWISVDETTDALGRQIANLIIGKLSETENTRPYLVASKLLEKTNNETIARFVNTSLKTLWPDKNFEDKVLLLVSDAAAYMLKAGKNLKIFYPNMLHITCLIHGLNRVVEEIRLSFPLVNTLISNVKKVFLKAPRRIQIYRENLTDLPLPPEPVLTRWGTWLEAAMFYADNLDRINQQVIDLFDPKESVCIKKAQDVLKNQQLSQDLCYIKAHFSNLTTVMTSLESRNLTLVESMGMFQKIIEELKAVPGDCGELVAEKIDKVLERNPDYDKFCQLSKILMNEAVSNCLVPASLCSKYKYAPITSCDVERSFSAYKLILTDKRHQFEVANLEKTIVSYCHSNYV